MSEKTNGPEGDTCVQTFEKETRPVISRQTAHSDDVPQEVTPRTAFVDVMGRFLNVRQDHVVLSVSSPEGETQSVQRAVRTLRCLEQA